MSKRAEMGMRKHGQSGQCPNFRHFTGKKAGKRVVRKGASSKQRKQNRGSHKNKYAHLAPAGRKMKGRS